jgi:uncharacterized membrane protein (UPF0127 family)
MLKVNPRKIRSVLRRKKSVLALGVGAVFVLAGLTAAFIISVQSGTRTNNNYIHLTANSDSTHYLDLADTDAERAKGLGGRDSMNADRGMLFTYGVQAERCFWMQDTRIPLDIIWVDDTKKVTHIEPDVSPDSYPRQYCAPGAYVIELNAGEARKGSFRVGTQLRF